MDFRSCDTLPAHGEPVLILPIAERIARPAYRSVAMVGGDWIWVVRSPISGERQDYEPATVDLWSPMPTRADPS